MTGNFDIGMVGLGVMGRNLTLNMAEKGFSVVGYDTDAAKVAALGAEAGSLPARGVASMGELAAALRLPRAVMMLVPAGPPVDAVIDAILPHLSAGDILIDGGNSYFKQTDARARRLEAKGILYMGVGVSGGEAGARKGPSIMPGGPEGAWSASGPSWRRRQRRRTESRASPGSGRTPRATTSRWCTTASSTA